MFNFITKILQKKHLEWLEQQTPAGTWKGVHEDATILIQFEGGPREGIYKQAMQTGGQQTKEFGHWNASLSELRLLIMATDVKDHARFGVDTEYTIRYVGPQSIKISGPDRPDWVLNRTDETLAEDFGQSSTAS